MNALLRILDLFSGAGGAAWGIHLACKARGIRHEIIGVDIVNQPRYPFCFRLANAMHYPLEGFDFIWASPPCQRYTKVWRGQEHMRQRYPDLIGLVRSRLKGFPASAIENVPGAPLRPDVWLTGAQFDLDIIRNRLFEIQGFTCPFELVRPQSRTVTTGGLACVAGNGINNAWNLRRSRDKCAWRDLPLPLKNALRTRNSVDGWRKAMDINWMTKNEMRQAVPPAYSEFIFKQFLNQAGR